MIDVNCMSSLLTNPPSFPFPILQAMSSLPFLWPVWSPASSQSSKSLDQSNVPQSSGHWAPMVLHSNKVSVASLWHTHSSKLPCRITLNRSPLIKLDCSFFPKQVLSLCSFSTLCFWCVLPHFPCWNPMVLSLGYTVESPETLLNMCMPITSPVQRKQYLWGWWHQDFMKVFPRVKPAGPLAGAPCPQSFSSWAPRAWSLLAHTRTVVNISFLASPVSGVYCLCLHFAISPHLNCNLLAAGCALICTLPWVPPRVSALGRPLTSWSVMSGGWIFTYTQKVPQCSWRAYFLSTASYQGSSESIITKP